MGDVLVRNGTVNDGTIATLEVSLHGLPDRSIDRDTAIAWMKDGHSFIPVVGGVRKPALDRQLAKGLVAQNFDVIVWIRLPQQPNRREQAGAAGHRCRLAPRALPTVPPAAAPDRAPDAPEAAVPAPAAQSKDAETLNSSLDQRHAVAMRHRRRDHQKDHLLRRSIDQPMSDLWRHFDALAGGHSNRLVIELHRRFSRQYIEKLPSQMMRMALLGRAFSA